MTKVNLNSSSAKTFAFLPTNFNKKKFSLNYAVPNDPILQQMQNMAKQQCLTNKFWSENQQIHAWMITAETATFMKCGGLGMVASELPENYNQVFASQKSDITIITPMYIGDTGRKKCTFENDIYTFFDYAIKVKADFGKDGVKRSIDQICFFDRENKKNTIATLIKDGTVQYSFIPERILKKFVYNREEEFLKIYIDTLKKLKE